MNTFYFNTGVKPQNINNFPYEYHRKKGHVIRKTLLIPFDCDVPKDSEFLFASNYSNIELNDDMVVREIHNSTMLSKYAYFRLKNLIK